MTKRVLMAKLGLALAGPILMLGMAEALLRSIGAGYPSSFLLTTDIQGQPYWINNPFYGYRFFHPELARNPAPISVTRDKPDSLIRVVVLGESAAQGDPMLEYGMPRMLEKMLNQMAGTSRYEVINAAMTAINSHVIVDIASDIVKLKPDIAVIYMGNNEVVGPYGPGTVFTSLPAATMLTSLRVQMSRLALFQVKHIFSGLPEKQWSGLDMFSGIHFTHDDPALEPMYTSFAQNLKSIEEILRKHGVRTIFSTVAVNLADCPPFGQEHHDAATAYQAGQRFYAEGEYEKASTAFKHARDLDTKRFRADRRINHTIRHFSERRKLEFVDMEQIFDRTSDDGRPPGAQLFLDHVHFTFEGTWHVARQFAAAIMNSSVDAVPSQEECRRLMFFTAWAERQQALLMRERRQRPPLNSQSGNETYIGMLINSIRDCSLKISRSSPAEMEEEYHRLKQVAPNDYFIPFHWGAILMESGRSLEAVPILTNALSRLPMHFEARILPALALCQTGNPEAGARMMVGHSPRHGYYLSEYAGHVIRTLEKTGYPSEARRFKAEVLKQAPRFPLCSEFVLAKTQRADIKKAPPN